MNTSDTFRVLFVSEVGSRSCICIYTRGSEVERGRAHSVTSDSPCPSFIATGRRLNKFKDSTNYFGPRRVRAEESEGELLFVNQVRDVDRGTKKGKHLVLNKALKTIARFAIAILEHVTEQLEQP